MSRPEQAELERMRVAIEGLPEPISTVYRLHLFDGLEYPAIAARLGIDRVEVECRVARAIVLIGRALREQERGGKP